MSMVDRTPPSPGSVNLAVGCSEALKVVGMVLTTATPIRWQLTHSPALLNSAMVSPSGFSAPTLVTGTQSGSGANTGPCLFGKKPAGYMCREEESLPAEATTATPR